MSKEQRLEIAKKGYFKDILTAFLLAFKKEDLAELEKYARKIRKVFSNGDAKQESLPYKEFIGSGVFLTMMKILNNARKLGNNVELLLEIAWLTANVIINEVLMLQCIKNGGV